MSGNAKALGALGTLILLAGCVPAVADQSPLPAVETRPIPQDYAGLGDVMGHNAQALERAFGKPGLDVREGEARKLQFASALCVLDAYLYPRGGRGEPVVTYVDARRPDGGDFDRASCIASLNQAR